MRPVRMPALGTTSDELTIVAWRKAVGEAVEPGEPLVEVETDKASLEVEAAGFRFVAEGGFLRNPQDPRDRETPEPPQPKDEFILKFVKP